MICGIMKLHLLAASNTLLKLFCWL